MDTTTVMRVSRNGQVSIPAATRARWGVDRVVVVDLGDHVLMRPYRDDAVTELVGKYAGRGPDTTVMRQRERAAEHHRRR